MENLILFIILISLGYFAGRYAEKRHYESIKAREKASFQFPMVTFGKKVPLENTIQSAELATGSAVISIDYFKRVLAHLRMLFGGRLMAYETLVDRARREAVLRMKESVPNSTMIINVRVETSSISKGENNSSLGSVEAFAYGTAIYTDQSEKEVL